MNAIEIAKMLISRSKTDSDLLGGEIMTNLKLQKMLYYEQGFHLAKFGTPLFEDTIEAWMYGPVVPSVYEIYKKFGSAPIDINVDDSELPELSDNESDLFEDVYISYNRFSAIGLVNLSHSEEPWKTAVGKDEKHTGPGVVISNESMKAFFREKIQ